jgi:electron transfer flavoprotein alpha subunit
VSGKVFVLIAQKGGRPDDSALELLAAARALFPEDAPVAIVTGSPAEAAAAAKEAAAAFPEVWCAGAEALAYPNAELSRPLLVRLLPPGARVLAAHDTFSMDLAPGLAVKLGAAYVPDVVGGEAARDGVLVAVRQEFNGQVSAHVRADISRGVVATVRSGAFRPAAAQAGGTVQDRSAEAQGLAARRRFRELVEAEAGGVDITREDVLVSVGRGIGEKENLEMVQDLADAMGATVSCSRPIVDAKWLEKARQVGTSGQTVKPKVYLALGISGSFQHLGGIKGSPFLVAVNKNPKAPIFQAASVGAAVDLLELLPVLTEKVKEVR